MIARFFARLLRDINYGQSLQQKLQYSFCYGIMILLWSVINSSPTFLNGGDLI